ncbi:XAP5, circadian clock regulator-domain-containing protein [Boeremia exigua]|uniref:XAP5, circadian clock regulator-domain-containing protein n=1 Tax=Boeremia exigua TaxID=749465 RepID=UPI001E8D3506|nr:XAP5, circadian clock regulator-domain-containing protein [Boeremia exigua]KAH6614898.1 XAP5, circadian clock regulator-domain-containing protein [Boeremia exigua]
MDKFGPSGDEPRSSTSGNGRFASQAATAEDLLKAQTVGLVNLDDYRKRRAEAIELKERGSPGVSSGADTPLESASSPKPVFKKKRKIATKGKLSFGLDEDEETDSSLPTPPEGTSADASTVNSEAENKTFKNKKLGANTRVGLKPRVMTKSALQREAQQADVARQDFLKLRERVKATEVAIPFVFYDGTNVPGGLCRVKKGDHIWLFLDKARKVGAELGVGGDNSRRNWARVSVDDLMLVRGEVILPHHYEFYYFLFNNVAGFNGPIFDWSTQLSKASPVIKSDGQEKIDEYDPLNPKKNKDQEVRLPDEELEGYHDDSTITKVVDRRWYEKNKHIFPASVWEEYSPDKVFTKAGRKDAEGNGFFFA